VHQSGKKKSVKNKCGNINNHTGKFNYCRMGEEL